MTNQSNEKPGCMTISAEHYYGMLNQDVPAWAEGEILHILNSTGQVDTWHTCPYHEPKDRR